MTGVGDWIERRAELSPQRTALYDATGTSPGAVGPALSYGEWALAVRRTARFLREACGVQKGDRVALLAKNSVEYLDLFFACGLLGAVLQNLNWRLTAGELVALIDDARPRVLLYGRDFSAGAAAIRGSARNVPPCVVALDSLGAAAAGELAFSERAGCSSAPFAAVPLGWDDPWLLCYTGGSTGLPKGALLTHGSILWNAVNTAVSWGLSPDDCAILNAPLFHTGGLNVFTTPLVHLGGASVVCREFVADQVFDLIEQGGPAAAQVTLMFGVPTMFQTLLAHPRFATAPLDRLKLVISGGAPCPPPVFAAMFARGVLFRTGYGLTEAGPNNFFLPDALVRAKPGGVGFPLFHVEAQIVNTVDGSERPCGTDEVGELRLRGPHVFAGYFERPDETAATLRGGWLYTGDLARRDEGGCHYIVGRRKDLIISGGENIYPAEIESVLAGHPAVREAAVIGVPDARWGEVGRAVVVPREAAQAALSDELLAYCQERLARYKVPKSVVLLDAGAGLPKTGAGKIDKPALRARHGQ